MDKKGFIQTTGVSEFLPISVDKARTLRTVHKTNDFHTELKLMDGRKIRGFSFPRAELEKALYGKSLSEAQLDELELEQNSGIYLAVGYHETATDLNHKGATLILYGVNSSNNLLELKNRIFDYSKPCPDNCPIGDRDIDQLG